jgi:hypothetical protein
MPFSEAELRERERVRQQLIENQIQDDNAFFGDRLLTREHKSHIEAHLPDSILKIMDILKDMRTTDTRLLMDMQALDVDRTKLSDVARELEGTKGWMDSQYKKIKKTNLAQQKMIDKLNTKLKVTNTLASQIGRIKLVEGSLHDHHRDISICKKQLVRLTGNPWPSSTSSKPSSGSSSGSSSDSSAGIFGAAKKRRTVKKKYPKKTPSKKKKKKKKKKKTTRRRR